ncbi:MAG TPA: hypothetical protein VE732_02745, partial [Nitrososphaera sp.]|nr:hypothetical protein [Nitrososphaera sp.]
MPTESKRAVATILLSAILMWGCKSSNEVGSNSTNQPVNKSTNRTETNTSPRQPDADGTIPSGT